MDRRTGSKIASWDRGKDFKEYISQKFTLVFTLLLSSFTHTHVVTNLVVDRYWFCDCRCRYVREQVAADRCEAYSIYILYIYLN